MQVRKEKTFNDNLVFDPRQLQQLLGALKLNDDHLKYSVTCLDGVTMRPTRLEDLIAWPNPEPRAITRIEVSTRFEIDHPVQINLRFGSEYSGGSAAYQLSGEEAGVYDTSRVIDDHLLPMMRRGLLRPGKAPGWSTIPLILGGAATTIGLILLPGYILAISGRIHIHTTAKLFWETLGAFALGIPLTVLGFKFEALATRWWPPAAFLIGAGRDRYERIIKTRANIFWSVLVGLGVGLLAGACLLFFT